MTDSIWSFNGINFDTKVERDSFSDSWITGFSVGSKAILERLTTVLPTWLVEEVKSEIDEMMKNNIK